MTERRSKYNARRVTVDGIIFDSIAEANRYSELRLLERAGQITGLKVHPRYELQPGFEYHGHRIRAIFYEADFEYVENGARVIEDTKGVVTPLFKLKWKMFIHRYQDFDFRIVEAK